MRLIARLGVAEYRDCVAGTGRLRTSDAGRFYRRVVRVVFCGTFLGRLRPDTALCGVTHRTNFAEQLYQSIDRHADTGSFVFTDGSGVDWISGNDPFYRNRIDNRRRCKDLSIGGSWPLFLRPTGMEPPFLQTCFRVFTGTQHTASFPLRLRPSEKLAAMIMTGEICPQWDVTSRYHAATRLIELRAEARH